MSDITLTWEQWVEQFKPIKNWLNPNAPLDGFMFETFGKEREVVVDRFFDETRLTVWTLLDEDGVSWITEGFHYVNRMGYLLTEVQYNPGVHYTVDRSVPSEHICPYCQSENTELAEDSEDLLSLHRKCCDCKRDYFVDDNSEPYKKEDKHG